MPAAPPPQETEDDPRVGVDLEARPGDIAGKAVPRGARHMGLIGGGVGYMDVAYDIGGHGTLPG